MKAKYLLSAGVAALTLSGVGLYTGQSSVVSDGKAPFVHPLAIAKSMCGNGDDELNARRRFFVRAANAYAATLDADGAADDTHMAEHRGFEYGITTSNPEAQAWFNTGLAHMYNFNHGEAINAFKSAQESDADCAMCFWAESLALGPNINAPMMEDAAAPAWAALQSALAKADGASEKEQALIKALQSRYAETPPADRSALDLAFAEAMDEVALAYPDDDMIAALAAEANMDSQPWDYWADGGRTPNGRTARTLSLLEGVIARNPNHAPSIHLYIHITEASQNPYRAADHADRLADLSPGLGHLIHMPSHTYYRIGRFKQSLATNIEAVAVDEAYIEQSEPSILYEFGYFTHNIHFAMTSAMMAGDGETALSMAKKLDEKLPIAMASAAPFVQPIKAAPYYAMVQFADPAEILALDKPSDEFPFLIGAWHYARGEAFAKNGDGDAAQREATAIAEIVATADLSPLTDNNVPVLDILNIARLTVTARASALSDDYETAIEAMEEASAIQDRIFYTEPPYWYYPSKQTLASLLLQSGETERAEHLFIESLTESPNNAWVLLGLSKAYEMQGDRNGAKYARELFSDAWLGDKKSAPSLNQL